LTWDEVKTAKVPAEVLADKSTKDRIDLEQKLRKEFNSSDQIKTFWKIKSSFQRVKAWKDANSAAWDLALIFSFMKMLDPWSVVREWEFATAQNAAWIPDQVRNLYNKAQTWERLNATQREDFLGRSEDIMKEELKNAASVRDQFVRIADDAWVTSDFITWAFDDLSAVDEWFTLDEEETVELKTLFPKDETTWDNIFKSKSWKEFNIKLWDFNLPDQTGWSKDTISFIKEQEWFSSKAFSDFKQTTSWFWTKALPWETSITQEEAEKRLQADVTRRWEKVEEIFWKDLTEWQKTALTSFMFNLGVNIFDTPSAKRLKDAIITWDDKIIKEEFVKFNRAWWKVLPWLTARRKRELEQFFINS
jgi:GH24 family phage-related lysozyme (muramidase)